MVRARISGVVKVVRTQGKNDGQVLGVLMVMGEGGDVLHGRVCEHVWSEKRGEFGYFSLGSLW